MRWHQILPVVAVLTLTHAATAEPLRSYTVSDAKHLKALRIESPRPEFSLCMLIPAVAGDCEGLETGQLAVPAQSGTSSDVRYLGRGLLRADNYSVLIDVTVFPFRAAGMTSEQLDEFQQGMRSALPKGAKFVRGPLRTQVKGKQAVLAEAEVTDAEVVVRTTTVSLFAEDQVHQVTVSLPADHAEQGKQVFDHVLTTLEYEPGDLGLFDKSRGFVIGYHLANLLPLLAPLALFAALLVVAMIVILRTRKKGSTTSA